MATASDALDTAKKSRGIARRSFTVTANKLEKSLEGEPALSANEITALFQLLHTKFDALSSCDALVDEHLTAANTDEDVVFQELEEVDKYKLRWFYLQAKYNDNVVSEEKSSESTVTVQKSHMGKNIPKIKDEGKSFRYPKLEFIKFDGDPHNWLNFWGQFSCIDNDKSLDDYRKFQYLIQATEKGSKARELISSFPPSAENYKIALEHLKERFGKEELIIEVYVRDLLNLALSQVNGTSDSGLCALYDKLTTQVRALETLGVTSEKYAAMLYPLVESALPSDIFRAFERTRGDKGNRLTLLLEFLKREVESVQRIEMARASFSANKNIAEIREVDPIDDHRATAATLVSSGNKSGRQNQTCVFCDKSYHVSNDCPKVNKLSLEERRAILKKKKVCPICLRSGHHPKFCKSAIKCFICQKRHNTVMCGEISRGGSEQPGKDSASKEQKSNEISPSTSMSVCNSFPSITFLQTLVVKLKYDDKEVKVRCLIDNGSQRSYIKTDLALRLGLSKINIESLSHSVFGGIETKRRSHNVYNVIVGSVYNEFNLCMSVLDETRICGELPRLNSRELQKLLSSHSIELSDVEGVDNEIGLLIGADYAGMIMTGVFTHLGDLTAIKTKLGWTVQGPKICSRQTHTLISLVDLDLTDLWKLESIGINDSARDASADEVIIKFEETIKVNAEGRYEVPLPWKEGHQDLLTNRELAYKRLLSTTKRLPEFSGYDNCFKEWLELGIIEPVLNDNIEEGHYLAHHAVIKNDPNATTKIRPVFDGSARDRNGISINGCLEKGDNFLETIPTLIIQFRMHEIGITSDIRKAFLQISIDPDDRKFLKFLWWKDENQQELITYQHCRVVFGLTCSPFLLAATINHHLLNFSKNDAEVAEKLRKSFYVDNCVTSVETAENAKKFIADCKRIMDAGKFDLRGWFVGPSKVLENNTELTVTSILGVAWNFKSDNLGCFYDGVSKSAEVLTKRVLLSIAQKTFDPIGFTAPVTLVPKILLQKCWLLDLKWDTELPDDIFKDFKSWFDNLHFLKHIYVPRRLSKFNLGDSVNTLHIFCDASQNAYATCIFLRSELSGDSHVSLVLAKARVSPTKHKVTMPRLELLAATIGARLAHKVKNAFNMTLKTYYWTDSKVTLTWIKKEAQWAVFVGNRVKEIRTLSDPSHWRYVPGTLNPADLPSRGCDAKTLNSLRWWKGPSWLYLNESEWPKSVDEFEVAANEELSKSHSHVSSLTVVNKGIIEDLLKFSSFTKMVCVLAWIRRFIANCRVKNLRRFGEINADEFGNAEMLIMKFLQREILTNEVLNNIKLDLVSDKNGLMRVKTKLTQTKENLAFVFPILLTNHPVVVRLIEHFHRSLQHAGLSIVMSKIREQYWIVGGRKLVRHTIKKCVRCLRFNSKNVQPETAPLPLARVDNTASPFETTGVDLAGPLYLSTKAKAYIVLFTCAVYRAIHLELITSLTTEAFIMALRRFFSRRGRVKCMYSDNGTNFHGFVNLFENLDWSFIEKTCAIRKIKWIFNAPTAAWWGGWWERMVRSVKELLRRVLGRSALDYEQLMTVLCDVETTINSRPLTYLNESDALVALSPSLLLNGFNVDVEDSVDIDLIDSQALGNYSKQMQSLRDALRERFKNEYLAMLAQKKVRGTNRKRDLKVGEIVLLETDAKRAMWPIGIITELIPGKDGVVRTARVKTAMADKVRPVQRLFPLEVCAEDANALLSRSPETAVTQTRSGRVIKIPERMRLV